LKINNSIIRSEGQLNECRWAVESISYRPCYCISARENHSQTRRTIILWIPLTNKWLNSTCQSDWPQFCPFSSSSTSL